LVKKFLGLKSTLPGELLKIYAGSKFQVHVGTGRWLTGRLFSMGDPIIIHGKAAPDTIESWPVIG